MLEEHHLEGREIKRNVFSQLHPATKAIVVTPNEIPGRSWFCTRFTPNSTPKSMPELSSFRPANTNLQMEEQVRAGNSLPLPEAFIDFLNKNDVDPSIYSYATTQSIPRYIRLKPVNGEACVPEIEADLCCKLEKVDWLPGFYSIPPHIQIASTFSYREGKIYGMDAASGAAVTALNVSPGDHVLDLCAAPGAKLCMLLDLLGSSGSLTGVDIARHRLAACRTMLQKYGLGDCCRLFVANGTSFSLLPPQKCTGALIPGETRETFKEWTSRRSWKERRASKARNGGTLQLIHGTQEPELIFYGRHSGVIGLTKCELFHKWSDNVSSNSGYDKVLVDAECTHDGSIKHIHKFENWGWETLQHRVLDAQRTDILTNLQVQLLTNGFRLLRIGGTLVYSTCSLTVAQNEDVVDQFLSENTRAELVEIEFANSWPCRAGRVPKTLRFDPMTSQTSGLFIAKITKSAL